MADKPKIEATLSKEQKKEIETWLLEKWKHQPQCPVCGNKSWEIADDLVAPLIMTPAMGIQLGGGTAYPQAMVICKNCGHTRYFNAVMMGLVPAKKEETNGGD